VGMAVVVKKGDSPWYLTTIEKEMVKSHDRIKEKLTIEAAQIQADAIKMATAILISVKTGTECVVSAELLARVLGTRAVFDEARPSPQEQEKEQKNVSGKPGPKDSCGTCKYAHDRSARVPCDCCSRGAGPGYPILWETISEVGVSDPKPASDQRIGSPIWTFTGKLFWPLDPRPEDFDISDIAHALACTSRFGGHAEQPYSVAQHCVLASMHVNTRTLRTMPAHMRYQALMHDAPEAYPPGDLLRPLKQQLDNAAVAALVCIQAKVEDALAVRFGLPAGFVLDSEVEEVDNALLQTEMRDLFSKPPGGELGPFVAGLSLVDNVWDWSRAEARFLNRYIELCRELGGRWLETARQQLGTRA
jgi:hypothetical protein